MPCMYSFCTWFSVRLGSVVVAIFSLIQGVILLLLGIFCFLQRETVEEICDLLLSEYDMLFFSDSRLVFTTLITFFAIYIISCILLVFGAFQLNIWEILPFVVCEFIRLVSLSYLQLAITLLIKKNVLDFNILIVCIITGGFVLLLLYYYWLCPLSLVQCIMILNKSEKQSSSRKKENLDAESMLQYYDYLSGDFGTKPIQPNRNYYQYQYQYGNMPKLVF